MSESMMAKDLLARLQRHYIKPGELMPGGMFMPEVSLGSRRADALYVGFFASRGKFLVGHEIKVARPDWLNELGQPEKAEEWERHCHSWYMVAPSTEIVRPEELPHGWGLMVPGRSRTRMDIVVKAALHDDRQPTWDATHALVQRADSLRIDAISKERVAAEERARADIEERVQARIAMAPESRAAERAEQAERLLAQVGDILGFKIVAGEQAWQTDVVAVEELRTSFAKWLAADKSITSNLNYRVNSLKTVRESLKTAEREIEALRDGAA